MNIKEIMELTSADLDAMSLQDLKKISNVLNSAANKRVKRLQSSGMSDYSPALASVKEKGKFSTVGKDSKYRVRNEITRAKQFLSAKTSSLKGAKSYKKTVEKLVKEPFGKGESEKDKFGLGKILGQTDKPAKKKRNVKPKEKPFTEAQRKKLFRALDKLREKDASKVYNIGSPETIKQLRRMQEKDGRMSTDRLVEALEAKYPELMESSEATYVREQAEYEARTDQDGVFRELTPEEEFYNPFK